MSYKSVDDFVWAHYETAGENISLPFAVKWNINSMSLNLPPLKDYVYMKWEEHKAKQKKLIDFRNSLDPSLRDCVDPFIVQQEKLRGVYINIWLNYSR
jgi:hypothetical protein